jgi:hypothetical protein
MAMNKKHVPATLHRDMAITMVDHLATKLLLWPGAVLIKRSQREPS